MLLLGTGQRNCQWPRFPRQYGRNPYVGYDSSTRPFLYSVEMPPHDIPALMRVVRVGDTAWTFERLREEEVITEGGEIDTNLILFMPGMTGNTWFDNTTLPRSAGGMIQANRHCKVEGMDRVYVAGDSGSFPGPDWMPKQAHMADLQAETAARNLLGELNGTATDATFKVELICIVDTNNKGILVSRTEKSNYMLPGNILFHWMKRGFERWYLRQYR